MKGEYYKTNGKIDVVTTKGGELMIVISESKIVRYTLDDVLFLQNCIVDILKDEVV